MTGAPSEWLAGTVLDLSSTGISFQCHGPLPINTAIEMVIDWPSQQDALHAMCLRASGTVLRTHGNEIAARITSYRMDIEKASAQGGALAASLTM
jgi:hypothetical protein